MEEKKLRELLGEVYDSLSEEQKAQAQACKTKDELTQLAAEAGVELPDEALDAVSGGCNEYGDVPWDRWENRCLFCQENKAQEGGLCWSCYHKYILHDD